METMAEKKKEMKTKDKPKEKRTQNQPDPTKAFLLKEFEKRLNPKAPDTYTEIEDMDDDIDEESLPKFSQKEIDEALKKNTKPS
ncbi:uncharacterized protein LOC125657840 isoform X3 [Ostrea edulis]|uniref:uncharacterized protein LOC125657840 isoform X3 n=1 Tax=Ostrea edulis TaxID=37623 RepID=UPI0024AF0644|nr:uncharacterized protein LOC125657840 isoform X3 [Ostrea edulis]